MLSARPLFSIATKFRRVCISASQVGGWLHEFTRLTGKSPQNFPFVLVGNKAEDDMMNRRQVNEHDVREWLISQGGRMPYIETSFGADPATSWRHAQHVFRTVARAAHRMNDNLGRHLPPETVRVPEEPEEVEARALRQSLARGDNFLRVAISTVAPAVTEKLITPVTSWASEIRKKLDAGLETLQERAPLRDKQPVESVPRPQLLSDCFPTARKQSADTTPPFSTSAPVHPSSKPLSTTKPLAVVPLSRVPGDHLSTVDGDASIAESKGRVAKRSSMATSKLRSALIQESQKYTGAR